MALEIVLPLSKKGDVKDLVFTILLKESPLKIIELTNYIRKRYGKSVTFQAVRKALLELVSNGVLIRERKTFSINRDWVRDAKQTIDQLYKDVFETKPSRKEEAIAGEVSVFTFASLNDLMKFWQDLIDDWFKKFKPGDPHINVYQCAHAWEGLLHLDRERLLMGQLKKKGISSYVLSIGDTPLDRNIRQFYQSIGIKFYISPSTSSFDRAYYIGTYGSLIIQTHYPDKLVKALDMFFKKNKTLEELNLKELSEIVNKKVNIKLTVIRNLEMAKQINKSIFSQVE